MISILTLCDTLEFLVRLNNWWVKMIRLLTRYEAGSQVFLRVTNFKSLRQVASYAISSKAVSARRLSKGPEHSK
jgi:hypothetical protein